MARAGACFPAIRQPAPGDPAVAIESSELPGDLHADPADRLRVAPARVGGTAWQRGIGILDCADALHLNVLRVRFGMAGFFPTNGRVRLSG